jgi:hypothetical protein
VITLVSSGFGYFAGALGWVLLGAPVDARWQATGFIAC